MSFTKLQGIYNAEGSITGEVKYFLGKLAGTTECSLCDISHKLITEKPEFTELKNKIPELEMLHLDETEKEVTELVKGKTPCVVGFSDTWQILISTEELKLCNGDVSVFSELLQSKI